MKSEVGSMKKKIVAVLRKLLLVGIAWLYLQGLYITWDGLAVYRGKADVAIVPGNPLMPDNSLTPWLQGRVDEALRLYHNKQVKKIFVSGAVREGTAMRNYLVHHDVDSNDVIADNEGINTYHTAVNFMQWNRKQRLHSAVMVSSFYHITRCKYILKKQGFRQVYGSPSASFFWADWLGLSRDVLANWKYRLVY